MHIEKETKKMEKVSSCLGKWSLIFILAFLPFLAVSMLLLISLVPPGLPEGP